MNVPQRRQSQDDESQRETKEGPLSGRHFLLLQGPFGTFYFNLASELIRAGAEVTKVHLNGADRWGWRRGIKAVDYKGKPRSWARWLERMIAERGISDMIMHSDSQAYHRLAADVARAAGLRTYVTEQGYLRPHWITFERGGVNANSGLLAEFESIRAFPALFATRKQVVTPTGQHTRAYVMQTSLANVALYLWHWAYPRYRNAFTFSPWLQCVGHTRRFFANKLGGTRRSLERLEGVLASKDPFYVALLQRPGDSQIHRHSPFRDLGDFCETLIESFANDAPPNARLVFKRHPLDHDLDDHRKRIKAAAKAFGVAHRVVYVDGGVLGQILPAAKGAITINSTAGLTAVEMGCPTICLGRALYDSEDMTHQDTLDSFWQSPEYPDADLVARFIGYVLIKTQINGDFSTKQGKRLAIAGIIGDLQNEAELGSKESADPIDLSAHRSSAA